MSRRELIAPPGKVVTFYNGGVNLFNNIDKPKSQLLLMEEIQINP